MCRVSPSLKISVLVDGGGDRRRRRDGFGYKGSAEVVKRAEEVGRELAVNIGDGSER